MTDKQRESTYSNSASGSPSRLACLGWSLSSGKRNAVKNRRGSRGIEEEMTYIKAQGQCRVACSQQCCLRSSSATAQLQCCRASAPLHYCCCRQPEKRRVYRGEDSDSAISVRTSIICLSAVSIYSTQHTAPASQHQPLPTRVDKTTHHTRGALGLSDTSQQQSISRKILGWWVPSRVCTSYISNGENAVHMLGC